MQQTDKQPRLTTVNKKLTKSDIEEQCTCAGVFLIRRDVNSEKSSTSKPSKDSFKVLLVESKRKTFQYSFPKGRRNKDEPTLETAKRELHEETGLTENDYALFPDRWYIEYRSDTGKPHIVYYAAELVNQEAILSPIDTKEIIAANWFQPQDIYNMTRSFYYQRRVITTRALLDFQRRNIMQRKQQQQEKRQSSSSAEPNHAAVTIPIIEISQ